jgi:FkbM family methyltransferase
MAIGGLIPYIIICVLCCLLMYAVTIAKQTQDCDVTPAPATVGGMSIDHSETKKLENDLLAANERVALLEKKLKEIKKDMVSLRGTEKATFAAPSGPGRNIFVDMGANDGSSVAYFLETEGVDMNVPWTQGGAKDGKLKGRGATGTWDLYVVEANPYFTEKLMAQRSKFVADTKRIGSYNVYGSTAITTENGPVTFKLDVHNKGNGNFGSTLMTDSRSVMGDKSKSVTVQGVDVADFLRDIVKVTKEDYLILKIDIEGKEYDVLKRLITSHMMEFVDDLAVEYHHSNYGVFGGKVGRHVCRWIVGFFLVYKVMLYSYVLLFARAAGPLGGGEGLQGQVHLLGVDARGLQQHQPGGLELSCFHAGCNTLGVPCCRGVSWHLGLEKYSFSSYVQY